MNEHDAAELIFDKKSAPRQSLRATPLERQDMTESVSLEAAHSWRCSLDLLADPPEDVAWLLPAILPMGAVVLLSGREGVMKSWLTMDWARAVAEGQPWVGRLGETGAVLYLDAEMPDNLFRLRLQAIGGSKNFNVWRWQDAGFPVSLDDTRLRKAAESHRLIVVDTLKRFMRGLEENSSSDMARITGALRELTRGGGTVLALHHAPKDPEKSGYRGSTELGAGVDMALTLTKQSKDGAEYLELRATKTRFPEDPSLTLQVQRTETRPVFHDVSTETAAMTQAGLATDLERLAWVIGELQDRLTANPNQSQVIEAARSEHLGSRNTILAWLRQGEGVFWQSELDGRSRTYRRSVQLSTCPGTKGEDGLDNEHQPD